MKRAALLLFIFFYLLSCVGMTVSRFYCCGVLQSTSIALNDLPERSCKMDSLMPDCCKTLKSSIKLKDHHLVAASVLHCPQVSLAPPALYEYPAAFTCLPATILVYPTVNPPGANSRPLYLFTCTYRI